MQTFIIGLILLAAAFCVAFPWTDIAHKILESEKESENERGIDIFFLIG